MTKDTLAGIVMLAIIGFGVLGFMYHYSKGVDAMIESNEKYSVVCDINGVCGFRD